MVELKKINKYMWEIPKTGKMKVPGLIFASEKLLLDMKKDKTFEQVTNVSTLPGIIGKSIALSDAHQGYGFSIGGVAAFDLDNGIVSPGGVGYDINCLDGNTKILSDLGYNKKIKDLGKNFKNESLNIFDKEKNVSKDSKISFFMKKYSEKIIKVNTESNNEILITKEHPIYTKNGMKEIKSIVEGDEILTYPFIGVEYEEPEKILLISEDDIDSLDRSFTSKLQIKNKLKYLGLLPLYSDNTKIPYLLKIMGFIFGDGSISITKNNKCQIGFYGDKPDLNLIKNDLKKIGFNSYFFTRNRKHKIKTQYKSYEFSRIEHTLRNSSSSLAILLNLLGTPKGNKTTQDFLIPKWIMNSVKWYKRLFLASLFGAEMSSPKTLTNNKFNLYGPVFSQNKKNPSHGLTFVNQISVILEEFDINSVLIKLREDTVNDKKSTRIRLMIYPDSKNLIKLFSKVNFDYNIKKRKLANAAINWLNQKEKIIQFRENIMFKAKEMKLNGFAKNQIIESLSHKYANKYFIDKCIYQDNYGRTGSRIAFCFISYNDFVKEKCYGEEGYIWDKIETKKEIDFYNDVYDLTINDENHNFIANNLVVSNCSVRLLKTNLNIKDLEGKDKKELLHSLFRSVPSGVGRGGGINLSLKELDNVLENGAQWAVSNGYGKKEDYLHTEEEGKLSGCNASDVSKRAKQRGLGQLGSLGAGNHFLEVGVVTDIYDEKVASVFGLKKDMITIMVHCGSRGLGHQVASDYIQLMEKEYGYPKEDRELVNAPIKSDLGRKYLSAMACAANFAFCNKQAITHFIRENLKNYFPNIEISVVYDICHNIAKFEKHVVDGKEKDVLILRKGATRSFGPGRIEIPKDYRDVGGPVLIPGSMGTASYVLVGTKKAEELTWGSTAHGAGRVKSRTSARKNISAENVKKDLLNKGIEIEAGSFKGIVEEAPSVYKDIDEVVKVSHETGIGKLVAKLKPLMVMKG
ncbi:RNA-splicing ligase RtcB [Candidatus Pacearchaeota archaeon]|nr:RNA-splicing ligase RtcB [Candidatus Pacearchaeota archaeon]